ncbi:MAG: dinitrogenase iron-molybdenum cofactor biosynthesis protein [Kiritimatiellae bacterium]|nr:dinitrogenase iron-molybdenum cofactor biosynthesis protein [Kiritimatiellia bacterium]
MKIAVCSENGQVFQHFGHTPEFLVCDAEGGKVVSETVVSSGDAGHGALAGVLAANKVETLLCGGIGGGAIAALGEAGIKVVGGCSGSSREAVDAFLAGTLQTREDFHCHHHDHEEGHSCSGHHHGEGHGCSGHCHG